MFSNLHGAVKFSATEFRLFFFAIGNANFVFGDFLILSRSSKSFPSSLSINLCFSKIQLDTVTSFLKVLPSFFLFAAVCSTAKTSALYQIDACFSLCSFMLRMYFFLEEMSFSRSRILALSSALFLAGSEFRIFLAEK